MTGIIPTTVFQCCVSFTYVYVRMLNTRQWTSLRVLRTPYVYVAGSKGHRRRLMQSQNEPCLTIDQARSRCWSKGGFTFQTCSAHAPHMLRPCSAHAPCNAIATQIGVCKRGLRFKHLILSAWWKGGFRYTIKAPCENKRASKLNLKSRRCGTDGISRFAT